MAAKTKKKQKKGDWLFDLAMDLRIKEIIQLSFDPATAKAACSDGLKRLSKYRVTLKKRFPGFALAQFDALPELADRLAAQQRFVQKAVSGGVVGELVPAALAWRRQLLPFAQTLAAKGDLDAREVAAIAAGAGTSDNLRDVLDLVKLLTPLKSKVESLLGAGALAAAQEATEAALGSLSTGRGASEAVQQAADLRDRYATLLVRWHDQLRAAFAAVVGYRDAGALVPPLVDGSRAKKEATPAAPT
jgi:hypothetical protein